MYKILINSSGHEIIYKIDTRSSFFKDENNVDYLDYLKWLEEGNTPEPADEAPKE